jgi:hypothetical protein
VTEAAVVEEVLRLARRHHASPEALAWLVRERQAAAVLVFQSVGRSSFGRPLWRVGSPDDARVFAGKSEAIRTLHEIAGRKAVPIALVTPAKSGAEAARGQIKRALAEIHQYCPPLADALRHFTIEDGVIRYQRHAGLPVIVTDRVGLALVSLAGRSTRDMIGATEEELHR